jgi:mannose-6-phosphate isomerase
MQQKLYPLKFQPILKEKIWGGQKLSTVLNKESSLPNIGESWEISDVDGDTSIVSEGNLKGKNLKELLKLYKGELVGEKIFKQFGEKFPLLIKFIDAKEDLSIQLHPNDTLAAERHNSFGKTEMWYVMDADKDANLIVGFKDKVTSQDYIEHLENKTLTNILNFDKVTKGDTYFIEVGRVHAIGAGVMLAEIQQTSDITYRVYDWDRLDDQGNARELHVEMALDAIDFNMEDNFRVEYTKHKNTSNSMVSCPYFTTNYIELDGEVNINNDKDSFIIYICTEGQISIYNDDFEVEIEKGQSVLVPAVISNFTLKSKEAKLLEVYV